MENRDLFDTTKKEGTVEQESSSSAMFGFAGTGKSHVLALILGELPPSKRISTPLAKGPVRAVGFVRMAVTLEDLEKMETAGELKFNRVEDDDFKAMFLKSAKEGLTIFKPTGIKKLKKKFRKLVHKPPEPTDEVEEDLIAMFHKLQGDTETLEGHIVIEMSDCGGQPQFLEVLAR